MATFVGKLLRFLEGNLIIFTKKCADFVKRVDNFVKRVDDFCKKGVTNEGGGSCSQRGPGSSARIRRLHSLRPWYVDLGFSPQKEGQEDSHKRLK